MGFKLVAAFEPTGDQPAAIAALVEGIGSGKRHQTLLGVTGSGKTFTMANVIERVGKPTLVISHNKTLAAQLFQEYRDFFPTNAVSYFVSYYDYYQPEAYLPNTDTYIEKETEVNELIDKLRLQATTNLLTRKDVIVVASVSCIYNLGAPSEYERRVLTLEVGEERERRELVERLTDLQYRRTRAEFDRGSFRLRGELVDLWPAYADQGLRIRFAGDTVSSLEWIDPVSGEAVARDGVARPETVVVYPAKHYLTDPSRYQDVFAQIRADLAARVAELEAKEKLVEAQRLAQRVNYDLEMIAELGYVNGIENYSRYFDGRAPGEPPHTLLDYFSECDPEFLTIIDESHMTIPQIQGMERGDRSRKQTLVEYGFRLPAAVDNRPLTLPEFLERVGQLVYTSATPAAWELEKSAGGVVEQLVRPTGLVDPEVEVRPLEGQVKDLIIEVVKRKTRGERVLVTTLTKRTAEGLVEYLKDERRVQAIVEAWEQERGEELGMDQLPQPAYLHADVKTLDRQEVLDQLRRGEVDVVVGINLLREGLDLPEVSLVAILDADQEGFLRSKTSLIQTMGRAARHVDGQVILYAQTVTGSMQAAIEEVGRRRAAQVEYNFTHGIMPQGIVKPLRRAVVERPQEGQAVELPKTIARRYRVERLEELELASLTPVDRKKLVRHLRQQMLQAADQLAFERAAELRDHIREIQNAR